MTKETEQMDRDELDEPELSTAWFKNKTLIVILLSVALAAPISFIVYRFQIDAEEIIFSLVPGKTQATYLEHGRDVFYVTAQKVLPDERWHDWCTKQADRNICMLLGWQAATTDLDLARKYFDRACAVGFPMGCAELGATFPYNRFAYRRWMEEACRFHHRPACATLGAHYKAWRMPDESLYFFRLGCLGGRTLPKFCRDAEGMQLFTKEENARLRLEVYERENLIVFFRAIGMKMNEGRFKSGMPLDMHEVVEAYTEQSWDDYADPWGRKIEHRPHMFGDEIVSSGPDRTFYTDDDVAWWTPIGLVVNNINLHRDHPELQGKTFPGQEEGGKSIMMENPFGEFETEDAGPAPEIDVIPGEENPPESPGP